MKLVIIGYGKMGRTIERLARDQNEEILGHIDLHTSKSNRIELIQKADVGIEFSHPDAALDNILLALDNGLPIVSGTTGWLESLPKVESKVEEMNGAFFYASNYSIGVNIFWAVNKKLALIMDQYPDYEITMDEVHHIHKKDEPSGTAITTAEQITNNVKRKSSWTLHNESESEEIRINSKREGEVFGIHSVNYKSHLDTIQLYHEAHTRGGFAQGAITAAKWLIGKQGIHGMNDLLEL